MALLRQFSIDYLSPKQLAGFDKYKYKSLDTSPFAVYIMHPFWNQFVKIYPLWLSPNILTFVGWLFTFGNFLTMSYIDWDFKAAHNNEISNVPRWVWFAFGVFQFFSHTLDGTDGKQARRTNSSSPLGELFDHGLDSMAVFLMTMSLFTVVGNGLRIDEFFYGYLAIMLGFYLAHWEKYNTSVLFLPWAYDLSQVALAGAYIVTGFFGPELWRSSVVGDWARLLHPEYCPSWQEGLVPMIKILSLFATFFFWSWASPTNILSKQPRVFCFALGIVYSNITCRLIVAQMSSTLCERFNWLFFLLLPTIFVAISGVVNEAVVLYIFTALATLAHVHYGICVVNQLCEHLGKRCFHISRPKSVANGR
eukprot:gene4903-5551_t